MQGQLLQLENIDNDCLILRSGPGGGDMRIYEFIWRSMCKISRLLSSIICTIIFLDGALFIPGDGFLV